MDKPKKRWSYLTFRGIILFVVLCIVSVIGALNILSPIIVITMVALILLFVWIWIIKPYLNIERSIMLFLEGYTLSEKDQSTCSISPATMQLFRQMQIFLSPTQLFNMNKRQAQYLALQNQINPHFLYNTLESIRSEAMMGGLDDVANMTESLATFFRYTITKVENLVSVEEELQNCQTYFGIQKYRFGDRLTLDIKCMPEDRNEIFRCRIPKLTMQPILENSIIHGTELKIGTGNLTINLERTENILIITISDDGNGMDEETLARINRRLGKDNFNITQQDQAPKDGLALVNVDNRIRLLFGEEYGLHVFSMSGVGTDVEISLPAIASDKDIQNYEVLQ